VRGLGSRRRRHLFQVPEGTQLLLQLAHLLRICVRRGQGLAARRLVGAQRRRQELRQGRALGGEVAVLATVVPAVEEPGKGVELAFVGGFIRARPSALSRIEPGLLAKSEPPPMLRSSWLAPRTATGPADFFGARQKSRQIALKRGRSHLARAKNRAKLAPISSHRTARLRRG